nr:ribonuclease H-like domain-containing protein [Tanacetum cinerariifolium]
ANPSAVSAARVNAAKPSTVSAARVNVANPSAVSAARVNAAKLSAVSAARITAVKPSAVTAVQHNHNKKIQVSNGLGPKETLTFLILVQGNPQHALKNKGVIDSGCSRHMTGNMSYIYDFESINGGYVAFGRNPKGDKITGKSKIKTGYVAFRGNPKGGTISGKGKIKTIKLDFDDVYFVKELKFNIFSVLQIRENNIKPLLCEMKGIKREFSVARTPQQNGVAERKNKTPIEADRTMLADSLLPILFWAEAVNTAYYVQNKVLVTKPHNKTPYELLLGRSPSIGFMRHFGYPVTILNTLDPLGKFDGKAGEGFFVGYSVNCKAFKVYNSRTRIVHKSQTRLL